jgi:hypothetical protein
MVAPESVVVVGICGPTKMAAVALLSMRLLPMIPLITPVLADPVPLG